MMTRADLRAMLERSLTYATHRDGCNGERGEHWPCSCGLADLRRQWAHMLGKHLSDLERHALRLSLKVPPHG